MFLLPGIHEVKRSLCVFITWSVKYEKYVDFNRLSARAGCGWEHIFVKHAFSHFLALLCETHHITGDIDSRMNARLLEITGASTHSPAAAELFLRKKLWLASRFSKIYVCKVLFHGCVRRGASRLAGWR